MGGAVGTTVGGNPRIENLLNNLAQKHDVTGYKPDVNLLVNNTRVKY